MSDEGENTPLTVRAEQLYSVNLGDGDSRDIDNKNNSQWKTDHRSKQSRVSDERLPAGAAEGGSYYQSIGEKKDSSLHSISQMIESAAGGGEDADPEESGGQVDAKSGPVHIWLNLSKGQKVGVMSILLALIFALIIVIVAASDEGEGRNGGDPENNGDDEYTCWEGGCGWSSSELYSQKNLPCSSWIFCQGPLLQAVELSKVFNDSKTFVDMPMKTIDRTIFEAFKALPASAHFSKTVMTDFVNTWFHPAGYELKPHTPQDYTDSPKFLNKISNSDVRTFAASVNSKWKLLVRKFDFTGLCRNCYSSLRLPNPFVVPGGRFREFYYWDSFWILQGLLVSEMTTTASDVIDNMVSLIAKYGFMPNGARAYYLDRSQPPVLTLMLSYFLNNTWPNATVTSRGYQWWATDGIATSLLDYRRVDTVLKRLYQEVESWNNAHHFGSGNGNGNCAVPIQHSVVTTYENISVLKRYCINVAGPRPESYLEDYTTWQDSVKAGANRSSSNLWGDIAAGAETGMDYSTRWFSRKGALAGTMASIQTSSVIPTDLNAIILRDEQLLAATYTHLADTLSTKGWEALGSSSHFDFPQIYNHSWRSRAAELTESARIRENAMMDLMWDQSNCSFFDFDLVTKSLHTAFYVSNFVPLWVPTIATRIFEKQQAIIAGTVAPVVTTACTFNASLAGEAVTPGGKVTYKMFDLQLDVGGIPTSLQHSGQQWDWPNSWAPSQWFIMEALRNWANLEYASSPSSSTGGTAPVAIGSHATTSAGKLHWTLVQNWVNNNYCGWKRLTGAKGEEAHNMFEKYNSQDLGDAGHGGEYSVQVGFGWTNGLILKLLDEFGAELTVPATC